MKTFAVVMNIQGSRWIDSQWASEEAAIERMDTVKGSFGATNQVGNSFTCRVFQFTIDDARLA